MKKWLGSTYLKMIGWRLEGDFPSEVPKMVMIAAPHTSNWDFPITMAVFLKLGISIRFLAKKQLFKFPTGIIMRAFGGIPVDRSRKNNLVEDAANLLQKSEKMILLIPVEGTRSATKSWRSGFYYIAKQAKVPIALGFLDYHRKTAGFLPTFYPTGDYEADLPVIQSFYKDIKGRHPERSALYTAQEN
ncbi:MAG: lysophospholipid acyltransferase family protein [Thermonemataceae bacterium]